MKIFMPQASFGMVEPPISRWHPASSSDRAFGLVVGAACFVFGVGPLLFGRPGHLWLLAPGIALIGIALVKPSALAALNRGWNRLGHLLGAVMGPILMAILFFGVVTPVGALMRVTGSVPIRLTFDRAAQSYWTARTPSGEAGKNFRRQY